jgi:hypothetical protein
MSDSKPSHQPNDRLVKIKSATKRVQKKKGLKKVDGDVDISDWDLASFDKVQELIAALVGKVANEAIETALDDPEQTYVSLPSRWAPDSDGGFGKTPKDPLTIYLHFALIASRDMEPVTYAFSLGDVLEEELAASSDGGGSWNVGLKLIRDELRSLANRIDEHLEQNPDVDAVSGV